ncbi:ATP-binding protein [Bacillus sp. FJAT-50079]|uniref:sensor histidine kinase n=1 Tax=Bacillus sp. FJAT-50079 TaxID=2833577 RepID=UPI001BCA403C|nr:ATP-binding protein [Bacillus sp. FJAT-50079]MBS4209297.1 HAMP domain-containing protein [Bacillus sp. FJAT-50079]
MKISLSRKLSFVLLIALIASIFYAYFFSNVLYERFYVKNMEGELQMTGERLAHSYEKGPVTDSFIDEINFFNSKSNFEVFAVRNPRELSMCLPFEVDYDALINGEDREMLLNGETVYHKGFVKRLNREVISVVVPLLDEKKLEGIIYLYYPLENVSEMTSYYTLYWIAGAALFLIIGLTIGVKWIRHVIQPLQEMKLAAKQVSEGNLSARIAQYKDDEIGQLAQTFNDMAESIQKEDEERRRFLENVSHELRTPLSYIKGYSEAIHMGIAPEKDVQKYQHIILRESRRMERLVGDLMELAKLESKEFSLEKMPIPLAQTIEESLEKVDQLVKDKQIQLDKQLDYELIVNADSERLEQMLLNILDNAIRYTGQAGKIFVSLKKEEGFGIIRIKDNGKGIPPVDLEKITQRFYRVNKARTRKEGGTGLGLSIVEQLTKLHGGTLEIESELQKGTTISIRLPLLLENE